MLTMLVPVYDGSGLAITNEDHAVNIFKRHMDKLHLLRDPISVATLLHVEKVIDHEAVKKLRQDSECSFDDRTRRLLMDVQEAISKDCRVLWTFVRVCDQTGNESIGEVIHADYGKFRYSNVCESVLIEATLVTKSEGK